jgi:hypothetical protein
MSDILTGFFLLIAVTFLSCVVEMNRKSIKRINERLDAMEDPCP